LSVSTTQSGWFANKTSANTFSMYWVLDAIRITRDRAPLVGDLVIN